MEILFVGFFRARILIGVTFPPQPLTDLVLSTRSARNSREFFHGIDTVNPFNSIIKWTFVFVNRFEDLNASSDRF